MAGGFLARLSRLAPGQGGDLMVAMSELALSRWRLAAQAAAPRSGAGDPQGKTDEGLIARVSWAIPRAAAVVPWRADCLVQAGAAQRWLSRHGIAADIRFGARKDASGRLDAHAWLVCRGQVVTGGDISTFVPFTDRPRDPSPGRAFDSAGQS